MAGVFAHLNSSYHYTHHCVDEVRLLYCYDYRLKIASLLYPGTICTFTLPALQMHWSATCMNALTQLDQSHTQKAL